ncbi:hypothetical protein IC229_09175 [Spirosoma sp. BT702]|uniref:Fibronectin type-III domain-containing protein n=1 Tax=Spirosoma profusum TaxID=2771354 RepID=A0A926XUQ9_9BACT|nr:fibronectin type III domain-containing protein [Spirosoma profusum]MBD2700808.1 hypothetical protein [Spirosoma profusum]
MKTTSIVLLCMAICYTPLAVAQNSKLLRAYAQPVRNENAIQVKWIIGVPTPTVQYHVLRRLVGEKVFKRLTVKPLQGIVAPEPGASGAIADAQKNYLAYIQARPKAKADARLYLQLFSMNATISNEFAQAAGVYYTDKTVTAGQTYEYAISAILKGKEYSWAVSAPVRAGNYQPLAASTGLKLKQEGTRRVAVNWTIRPDVLAYNVYRRRGTGGMDEKINKQPVIVIDAQGGKQPSTQFTDTDSTLRVGETYYYRIAALDPFVNPGELSQPVWLTIKDMDPPAGPTNLSGRIDNRKVRLGWTPSPARDCIGYRLFRSTSMEKPFQPVLPRLLATTDTTFTDETALEGSTYYYYLRAEDQAGNGANTLPIQVSHPDLTPPASPTGLVAQTDTTGHVRLSWKGNTESDLAGYFVYRGLTQSDDNYAQLQLAPHKLATYRDTLLRNNRNAFYYRVTAVDKMGNESKPALLTVRLPDRRPPITPHLQTLTATGDSVQVIWQASSSEDVRVYHVLRQNENDAKPTYQIVGRTSANRFSDRNVASGTYRYAIQAVDSTGNTSQPSIPRLVQLIGKYSLTTPANVNVQLDERGKRLTVSWNRTQQPTDFAGYRVLARDAGETFRAVTPLLAESQAVLTDWENGSDYEIAVVAVSQTGRQLRSEIVKAKASN